MIIEEVIEGGVKRGSGLRSWRMKMIVFLMSGTEREVIND